MTTKRRKNPAIESPGRREERSDEIDGGTSDADKNVDKSPDAVERRRETQSGPGAPGVDSGASHADEEQERERRLSGEETEAVPDGDIADEPTAPHQVDRHLHHH